MAPNGMERIARKPRPISALRELLTSEAGGGIVLMFAVAAALATARPPPLASLYFHILHVHFSGLSLIHWINDGLMAVFFLLVGLEIKREFVEGQLASWQLAILDDLGAIAIIALVYTEKLSAAWILAAAFVLIVLAVLGRCHVRSLKPYLALGVLLWFFTLKSGVHATLAGVALALLIPLPAKDEASVRLLLVLEHALQKSVAYLIVPIFGFANARVSFASFDWSSLLAPVTLGVAAGLFFGKQMGCYRQAGLRCCLNWRSVRTARLGCRFTAYHCCAGSASP